MSQGHTVSLLFIIYGGWGLSWKDRYFRCLQPIGSASGSLSTENTTMRCCEISLGLNEINGTNKVFVMETVKIAPCYAIILF